MIETKEFWAERSAEIERDVETQRQFAQSLAGRKLAAQKRIDLVEGDQAAHTDAERAEAWAALAAIEAEEAAAFWAEWTAEVTAERKAAWNARMAAEQAAKKAGKAMTPFGVIERELDFRFDDLKKAAAHYK